MRLRINALGVDVFSYNLSDYLFQLPTFAHKHKYEAFL